MPIELSKIFAVWLREVKRFTNSKSRMLGSLAMPLLFLAALGGGIGSLIQGFNYQAFILPGIIGMTLLFNSMFSGVSIIWDRELGYLKELLAAPTSRTTIVIGKALGGATTSVVQGMIILILGMIFGLASPSLFGILFAIVVMIVFSTIIVSFGIALASIITEIETFQLIINLLMMPLFFLSNALFPLDQMPSWLKALSTVNPVSYGVDALRTFVSGAGAHSILLDVSVLGILFVAALIIAGALFNKTSI